MRHAREIIRLKFSACVSTREIARRLGVAASTVRETLKRFESAGLVWPLPADMTDGALEGALYANRRSKRGHRLTDLDHDLAEWIFERARAIARNSASCAAGSIDAGSVGACATPFLRGRLGPKAAPQRMPSICSCADQGCGSA